MIEATVKDGWVWITGVPTATRTLALTARQADELREVLRGALRELSEAAIAGDAEVAIEDLMRDAKTPLAPFARG